MIRDCYPNNHHAHLTATALALAPAAGAQGWFAVVRWVFITAIIAWPIFLAPISAAAEGRPYSLVCFDQRDLRTSLSRVINMMQFLRNDSTLRRKSCDFVRVPSGSSARFIELFETEEGFIYPIFLIRYATTGQRMYAADGIFRSSEWRIRRPCGPNRAFGCLIPKDCGVLEGFLRVSGGSTRTYMFVPRQCETLTVR